MKLLETLQLTLAILTLWMEVKAKIRDTYLNGHLDQDSFTGYQGLAHQEQQSESIWKDTARTFHRQHKRH